MNVGAFVDVAQKQVSGFVRGQMDAGKYGVVVADVEGVELQKEWTVSEGALGGRWPAWAASTVSVSAGLGFQRESRGEPDFNPRPYVNFDVRPSERNAKGAMVSLSLVNGQPVDLRPALAVDRHRSVEFPITITGHHLRAEDVDCGLKRDDAYFNAHLHGVVGCYKFDNSEIEREIDWQRIKDAAKRIVGREKKAGAGGKK